MDGHGIGREDALFELCLLIVKEKGVEIYYPEIREDDIYVFIDGKTIVIYYNPTNNLPTIKTWEGDKTTCLLHSLPCMGTFLGHSFMALDLDLLEKWINY